MNIEIDFSQDSLYPQLAADWLDVERTYFGNCRTITVWSGKKLLAIVVYSAYTGINCEMSVAAKSKNWARKDIISVLLKYPFDQLGCQRITLLVRENNKPVIRLAERVGFIREGCLRQFHDDGTNCIVLGMLKSERRH